MMLWYLSFKGPVAFNNVLKDFPHKLQNGIVWLVSVAGSSPTGMPLEMKEAGAMDLKEANL